MKTPGKILFGEKHNSLTLCFTQVVNIVKIGKVYNFI